MSTILLIEDDVAQLLYIKTLLQHDGHTVIEATEGEEAIRLFKKNSVDVVLTDIFMPGKEGLATIMELRELAPATRIIAMTAGSRALPDALDIAVELGADFTLKKPLDKAQLNQAIGAALATVLG